MKMNNQDRWLIERWEKTRQLEEAMNATRQRFENLFVEIYKSVKQNHPSLDRLDLHLSPREIENYGSNVIFSKGSWPSGWETWRTGIYLFAISLDELSSEKKPGPDVSIFFQVKKSDGRIEEFRKRIVQEAPRIFKDKKIVWETKDEDDNRTLLFYQMPEGKSRLLKMLCDGKEQEFVDCITSHISLLCGFIPVLDELLER
jgi:hypothetical protein